MVDVVFDASALILMAKIGLLNEITEKISIYTTEEIYSEATKLETFDSKLIQERAKNNQITKEKISEEKIENTLEKFNLDKGEASAIVLCKKIEADILATDDKQAINACKIQSIRFTTSLKLLEHAHQKQLLSRQKALAKLKELDKHGWYKENQIKTTEQNIRGEKQK